MPSRGIVAGRGAARAAHARAVAQAAGRHVGRPVAHTDEKIEQARLRRAHGDTLGQIAVKTGIPKPRSTATSPANGEQAIHSASFRKIVGHGPTSSVPTAHSSENRRQLRPADEYRSVSDTEWSEFEDHFAKRKIAIGDCMRAYGTNCVHE